MKCAGGVIGLVMALTCAADARGQVFFSLPLDGRGSSVAYQRRVVLVSGYLPGGFLGFPGPSYFVSSAFGAPASRVTIYSHAPREIVAAPKNDELAGVDLDVVKPPRRTAPRAEPVPEGPEPALPGVNVSVPRPPVRPGDAEPAKKPRPPAPNPPPMPPREEPRDESGRLLQLGRAAFANQEHGLAALRFQQAATADPLAAPPQFFLGQALFALAKYREAVEAIHAGMRLKAGWPQAPFRPRRDLYQGNEADFDTHLKRLETVVAEQPNNETFLFLLGYQLWFDGRRAEAVPMFRRARDTTADATYLDQFLKAPPPGPLAAN